LNPYGSPDDTILNYSTLRCDLPARRACGTCDECRRRAAVSVAARVLRTRYDRRGRSYEKSGSEERKYAQTRTLLILDALGLAGEASPETGTIRLSEWGEAMRRKQL
jgi:hypothetical protein